MTEKYPRACGVFADGKWDSIHDTEGEARCEKIYYAPADCKSSVVELIPLPEHQDIVAAAVAAAVERCAGIADGLEEWIVKPGETESQAIVRTITEKIREVPK